MLRQLVSVAVDLPCRSEPEPVFAERPEEVELGGGHVPRLPGTLAAAWPARWQRGRAVRRLGRRAAAARQWSSRCKRPARAAAAGRGGRLSQRPARPPGRPTSSRLTQRRGSPGLGRWRSVPKGCAGSWASQDWTAEPPSTARAYRHPAPAGHPASGALQVDRTSTRLHDRHRARSISPRWHEGRLWFCDWGARGADRRRPRGQQRGDRPRAPSFPFCIDWLPDGRLLVVSARDRALLRPEPDGSLRDPRRSERPVRPTSGQRDRRRRPRQRVRQRRRLRPDGRGASSRPGPIALVTAGRLAPRRWPTASPSPTAWRSRPTTRR